MHIKNTIDLSIIIVSWNTSQITCNCIQSIYDNKSRKNIEIIVIDNASIDNSVENIRKQFADVVIIENKDNKGFAYANNQGIDIARGNYILLVNSDTVILENCIDNSLAFANSHLNAGIIGCKAFNSDMTWQMNCFRFPSLTNELLILLRLNSIFPESKIFNRVRYGNREFDIKRKVEAIAGCFMLIKKEALDKVGKMDENFFMYAEEADWCYRFHKSGWQVYFTPDAEIIHLGGQSSKQVKPKMILQLRAGTLQFIKKHHSVPYYVTFCIITSLWFGIRIIPWLIVSIFKPKEFKSCILMAKTYFIGSVKSLFGYKALEFKR